MTTATTSTNKLLADTARWVAFQIGRLPESQRPDVEDQWRELLEEIEVSRSTGSAEVAVTQWRSSMTKLLKAVQEDHTNEH